MLDSLLFFRRFSFFLFIILILAVLSTANSAKADLSANVAAVQCDSDHNRVLIRFGSVDEQLNVNDPIKDGSYAQVPSRLAAQWTGIPYINSGTCHFKDGQIIQVSTTYQFDDESPDSPSDFTLIINGHYVYDGMEFYTGYANYIADYDLFTFSALEYNGKSLLECDLPEVAGANNQFTSGAPVCHDSSQRLLPGTKFLTGPELQAWNNQKLQESLKKALSPFCRSLNFSNGGNGRALINAINWGPDPILGETSIDINNDGKLDRVFSFSGDTHVFDGSYLIAFTKDQTAANNYAQDLKNGKGLDGNSRAVLTPAERKASISLEFFVGIGGAGGQSQLLVYKGKTYIYASSTDTNTIPSGMLMEMMPDNSTKTICTYP